MSAKKKILYVVTKSVWGGAQKYVFDLATNLAGTHDITVAAGGTGPLVKKLEQHGVHTITIPRLESNLGIIKEFRAIIDLYDTFVKESPDIIHLNSSKAGGLGATSAWAYKKLHSKDIIIVFTAHGWPFHEKRNFFLRVIIFFLSWLTAFFCDKVITISRLDHRYSRRFWPIPQKKFVLIPNGIGPISFYSRGAAKKILGAKLSLDFGESIIIGTIAELTTNKGLRYLIEAIEIVNKSPHPAGSNTPREGLEAAFHPRSLNLTAEYSGRWEDEKHTDIQGVVIGDGSAKEELEQLASKHANNVRFAGFMDHAEELLRAFDIFVLPSIKEGLPYTLMGAMAAGLPVVATPVGGIPDLITDGSEGILVAPKNPEAIAVALASLIGDMAKRKLLGKAAVNKISDFNLKTTIEKTLLLAYDIHES